MKKTLIISFLLLSQFLLLNAQIDKQLREDVRNTGYIHKPLPLDHSKSFETFGLTKKVLQSDLLIDMEDMSRWSHRGIGTFYQSDDRAKDGKYSLKLTAPTVSPKLPDWGIGLGTSMATYDVGGANWEKYNRLHFYIYPECEGARSIYLNMILENDGKIKVPDKYEREGIHEINLINGEWNEIFVEISELARDKVTKLSFAIETFGRERIMGDSLKFDIDNVKLQVIENPEVVSGWQPAKDRIIFSTSGYGEKSQKTAIVNVTKHNGTFRLIDYESKLPVYEGKVASGKYQIGKFNVADFSDFTKQGRYCIKVGDVVTAPFYIHSNVWDDSAWRVANFMFVERCGYPVPGKHSACHADLNGEHNGKLFTMNGGWHDAADMSQQTLQTGEIAYAIFEAANNARRKGDTDLFLRLKEEALWGLDYILKSRFGDGYRAHNWGTNLWTDGFVGTMDDSHGWRRLMVHNRAFENFLLAGIEAYAAMSIDSDPMLREYLEKIAEEDFAFALERFKELGFADIFSVRGPDHAGMASQSQYHANISYAASLLYKLTGKQYYADKAADFIKYTLQCQRTEPIGKDKFRGFFYRDTTRKSIVHYTHQSRDQVYMQALTALCETQPEHADYAKWENGIRMYGEYLKKLMKYVEPYGMVPSGIYHKDEINDSIGFYQVQFGIRGGVESDFREQLENGVKLDKEHYLRVFPVWFSFKGNAAVHLATGKNAALAGKFLNDPELINIAEQQLMWIVGKNPFGQSLIWGEGSNYAQQYTALPGETVGEIPVGMQTRFNEDTPYWPQINTATYKEVWGTSAGKWFSLIAEF